jgi:CheY-like chemotaxis protein
MPPVIALVDDLVFASRIREAARGAGFEVRSARRADDLLAAVREGGRLVLVDADSDRLPWRDAVAALRSDAAVSGVPVIAFLSHVNAERAQAAREAGATRVMARGAFVQELPALIAQLAAPPHTEEKNR